MTQLPEMGRKPCPKCGSWLWRTLPLESVDCRNVYHRGVLCSECGFFATPVWLDGFWYGMWTAEGQTMPLSEFINVAVSDLTPADDMIESEE